MWMDVYLFRYKQQRMYIINVYLIAVAEVINFYHFTLHHLTWSYIIGTIKMDETSFSSIYFSTIFSKLFPLISSIQKFFLPFIFLVQLSNLKRKRFFWNDSVNPILARLPPNRMRSYQKRYLHFNNFPYSFCNQPNEIG